jgi:integrase
MERGCDMDNTTKIELLNFAMENGMIDVSTIQKQIEMNERKKFLEMHNSKVWQSTDQKWYTYLPDFKSKSGKKLVKRKTKEDLENVLIEFYKNFAEPQTVEKTYKEWIAKKVKFDEISKQTVDRYEVDFNKYFHSCKDKEIRTIDEDFLEDFIIDNIRTHSMKSKAWSNLRTIIRGLFLFAKKKNYTTLNIVEFLSELDLSRKMFNHDKKPIENVIYNQSEADIIIKYIKDSKNLNDIAIQFAIYTGMRVGEIVALRWEDLSDDYIHISRMQERFTDENKKIVYQIRNFPKTEAGIRDVVIVPELKAVIRKLRAINPFTEYLFEKKGECIHKHSVCTRLYSLCDKFGFPHKGMHAFRRYYATKLINAGVEEMIVISQMGHTDFKTTKNHYYKNNADKEYMCQQVVMAMTK